MTATTEVLAEFQHTERRAAESIPVSRRMVWLLQRELWENRSITLAPLIAAALFLFGLCVGFVRMRMHGESGSDLMPTLQGFALPAYLEMGVGLLVATFYSLDALYGERRDRSILFWKSLPVSDTETVVSKALIPIVVVPLVTFAVTVVTQWAMLLLSMAFMAGSGQVGALWRDLPLTRMAGMSLFHLLGGHGFWYAPFFGWFLLVSAWARRTPFLWAVLPPLVVGVFEKIALHTTYFAEMLRNRFAGSPISLGVPGESMSMHGTLTLGQFLMMPGLWTGLLFTAVCLGGAVWLRRSRGPS
jgi:ABC-2 type transport system permease protein